jgi:murein DD-endopeptidase MepM/ murein hydrolase activator NlpD
MISSLALVTACARASVAPEPVERKPVELEPVAPPVTSADAGYFAEHSLMVPVEGVSPGQLRDSFNEARDGGRMHRATDILAPRGTPVLAAIDGEVVQLKQNSAGGLTAYLTDDEHRYIYYYAHLDRYSDALPQVVRIKQGFVIGYVGTTGNAPPNTPHLHFQAMRLNPGQTDWWNGTPVDVRSFMTIRGKARQ